MDREAQSEIVLGLLKSGVTNTLQLTRTCLDRGIMRPAARVFDLREAGHDIRTTQDGRSHYYTYHGQRVDGQLSLI